mmetsp:Transcript_121699/g.221410  ORF Transcript_121699/g.221410 Transcript_121699/m.221410 type:complete len:130 (+) Transcript_121699:340-729(+)
MERCYPRTQHWFVQNLWADELTLPLRIREIRRNMQTSLSVVLFSQRTMKRSRRSRGRPHLKEGACAIAGGPHCLVAGLGRLCSICLLMELVPTPGLDDCLRIHGRQWEVETRQSLFHAQPSALSRAPWA